MTFRFAPYTLKLQSRIIWASSPLFLLKSCLRMTSSSHQDLFLINFSQFMGRSNFVKSFMTLNVMMSRNLKYMRPMVGFNVPDIFLKMKDG